MRNLISIMACAALTATPAMAKPREKLTGKVLLLDEAGICKSDEAKPEFLSAILAALLPGLIQTGVKGIGSALTKAASPDEATVKASVPGYFYGTGAANEGFPLIASQNCIAFVVDGPQSEKEVLGRSISMTTTATGTEIYKADDSVLEARPGLVMALHKAGYRHNPLFLYVGRVETAADKSAWRLVPKHIWTGGPLTVGGARGKGRDLVLTPYVEGASAAAEANMLAQKPILMPRVTNMSWTEDGRLEGLATGWIPFPKLPEIAEARRNEAIARQVSIKAIEELPISKRTEAQKKQLAAMNKEAADDPAALARLLPVQFGFDLHETRDGNRFLQKVGEFLAGNAEAIAKPIAAEFDGDAKRAAAIADATSATGLQVAAIEAVDAWETAVADPAKNEAQRRILKMKAVLACNTLRANKLDEISCGKVD